MKKLCIILFIVFSFVTLGHSQINLVYNNDTTTETVQLKKSGFCHLMYDSVYTLSVRDVLSPNMIDIKLGHNVGTAQKSISQLVEWMNGAKKNDYIMIEQGDERFTVYKANSTSLILSTGDAKYCESLVHTAALASWVSATYALGLLNANEKVSIINKSDLRSILKKIK